MNDLKVAATFQPYGKKDRTESKRGVVVFDVADDDIEFKPVDIDTLVLLLLANDHSKRDRKSLRGLIANHTELFARKYQNELIKILSTIERDPELNEQPKEEVLCD